MDNGKDFEVLFRKWQEQQLTSAEKHRLMQLIESGAYGDDLNRLLSEHRELETGTAVADGQEAAYERLIANIRGIEAIKERTNTNRRLTPVRLAAIAASFILLAAFSIYMYRGISASNQTANITKFSDKQYFRLPDGTAVTLNDNSTLTYNQEFGNKIREVTLSGEAFFDVAHVPNRPFIVRTRKINTTVLGTAFNINSFTTQVVVTVMRGKVKVSSGHNELGLLTPNEAITVNSESLAFQKSLVDSDRAIAWKSHDLVMDEVTMKQAAKLISDHFNATVLIEGETLADCKISAFFIKNESLKDVLEAISITKGCAYTLKDSVATLRGECQ